MEKHITISYQSEINMSGTFTSSQDGVTGTGLPFLHKQVEDQTKHMEKMVFRHWTTDHLKLDHWENRNR